MIRGVAVVFGLVAIIAICAVGTVIIAKTGDWLARRRRRRDGLKSAGPSA